MSFSISNIFFLLKLAIYLKICRFISTSGGDSLYCMRLITAFIEQVMEPDKCEEWGWVTFDEIKRMQPEELFLPVQNLLKQSLNWEATLSGI